MLLFTFAGSSHSKYTTYLLETVCNLELESSPALRDAILRSTLVNLTGHPGSFTAADIMQEYFNRLLEALAEKKGVEYGSTFLREVVSPNLHHFARIKLDLRDGIGLQKRSGSHAAHHLKPEIHTLLKTYSSVELHFRRPGRVVNEDDKDDFVRGMGKLRNGKVKKWAHETSRSRALLNQELFGVNPSAETESDRDSAIDSEEEEEDCERTSSLGFAQVIDGELVFSQPEQLLGNVDELMARRETLGDIMNG